MSFGGEIAPGGAVPAARAEMDDIVGHHALDDIVPREQAAQRLGVGNAVLEADHRRALSCEAGDLLRGGLGADALDGESDDVGALERRSRLGVERDPVGGQLDVPALRVAEAEAVLGELVLDPLPPEKGDVEAGGEPGATDIAADRPGAVDDDLQG